jgi:site-specific DNA recombinase
MRVAVYARYSSENQSEKSIEDQVRVCRNYVKDHGLVLDDRHIFVDEAISGSIVRRPGLEALEKAAEAREFDAVAVDDLSRLSRSNHQMLTLVLRFNYYEVKIISVSDGIVTGDENAKLGIQVRGLINELYLDDLKKKTMRGLEGQKLRGFSAGEWVYGYVAKSVGEMKINRKGQAKYEGMVHEINPEEAEVVKRIFQEFVGGKSLHRIAADLNADKIPTKKGLIGGWNTSTLSRFLENEKYVGVWEWRKFKNVRDPMTGRIKKVQRPKAERLRIFREDLIILDESTWEKAQKKKAKLGGTWPVRRATKVETLQRSYVHTSPCHLLSGLLRCHVCGGAVVLVAGKGGGYYGCFNAKRKTCGNKLTVARKTAEKRIISDLQERVLTAENVEYVFRKVEELANEDLDQVPELMKKKKSQQDKVDFEIRNYLQFIKRGNLSKAVSEALSEAEKKKERLQEELEALEYQKANSVCAPPREWMERRLAKLRETLNKDSRASGLALKELLGTVSLEPVSEGGEKLDGVGKHRRAHYLAHTKIQTLALLDDGHKVPDWPLKRRE